MGFSMTVGNGWLLIKKKLLVGELAFDNGDAARFAGFDLHLCLPNIFLEFTQQQPCACLSCCYGRHVIHVCPYWGETQTVHLLPSDHPP